MCSRESKRKPRGMKYTFPVKSSYRSPKTIMSLKTSAFNPSPVTVNQYDLLSRHMEAHYRRVTSAKGRTDTSTPESLLKCTKVQDQAKRHSQCACSSVSGRSSPENSLRSRRALKTAMSCTSSKSDAGFVSMTTSLESLHMAEEELDYGGCLSTSEHHTAKNKRDIVHLEDHLLPASNSEHRFELFSTDTTDYPGRLPKYKHLLGSPLNEDTKWQLYHTRTGQLTGYLRYRERSGSSKCPPSSGSVSTSPWKPAFNTNSPYSLSSAFPSPTVLQSYKGTSPSPHYKRDTGTHRKIKVSGLQPQGEDSFGETQTLNKPINPATHSISSAALQTSAPTGIQSDQESQLQDDSHSQYKPTEEDANFHGVVVDTKSLLGSKALAEESTSHREVHNTKLLPESKALAEKSTSHREVHGTKLLAESKALAEESTSHGEVDNAKSLAETENLADKSIPQNDKSWTDEGQIDRPSHDVTQDMAASYVSSVLPQRELSPVQSDKVTVVSASERGRELFAKTNELSLQAQAVGTSLQTLRRRIEEERQENEYLEFVAGVTRDILARGVLSDLAMALLFQSHIERHRHRLRVDIMLEKIQSLKKELGIQN